MGSEWAIFVIYMETTTSSTVAWIAQVFKVNGMSVGILLGESSMNEPEAVVTLRDGLLLKIERRGVLIPYITPLNEHPPPDPSAFFPKCDDNEVCGTYVF